MYKSKKGKGAINSTQSDSDSVKNQLQDTKNKQLPIDSNKTFIVKNIIPRSTIVIKCFKYQFKIEVFKNLDFKG